MAELLKIVTSKDRSMLFHKNWWCLLLLTTIAFPCNAELPGGHLKIQQQYATSSDESLATLLGHQDVQNTTLDFRIRDQFHLDNWQFVTDYLLLGATGSAVEFNNQLNTLFPGLRINREDTQWFDLDHEITSSNDKQLKHRFDRLYIEYGADQLVIKLGRQAITWGNGQAFRPMDLFNPFAPDAIDTSYKPGSDMFYGQWLFENGSDVSALIVPRRNPQAGQLENEKSSAAIKWHLFGQLVQTDLMIAVDYEDTVVGIGMNGPVAEAVWRFDLVPVFLEQGGTKTSAIVNLDHAWEWRGKNYTGHIEYFRNGFGSDKSNITLVNLSTELVERIARGQVFNTGRDYLSGGVRVEITPLMQISPLLLINLNDSSGLLVLQGGYSFQQNMELVFGANIGLGGKGTEYGGLEISPGSGVFNEPLDQLYLRYEYYF